MHINVTGISIQCNAISFNLPPIFGEPPSEKFGAVWGHLKSLLFFSPGKSQCIRTDETKPYLRTVFSGDNKSLVFLISPLDCVMRAKQLYKRAKLDLVKRHG